MEISKINDPYLKFILKMASMALHTLEISFALFFLLYVSTQIPSFLQLLLRYCLHVLAFVASPIFAFGLCNAIIAAVIAKALRSAAAGDDTIRGEFYDEVIKIGNDQDHWMLSLLLDDAQNEEENHREVVVYEGKQIIGELRNVCPFHEEDELELSKKESVGDSDEDSDDIDDETTSREKASTSNEEFKRRVEDFIEKELRFRREESFAIVLQSC